jgi:hypothetical protein
MLWTLSSHSVNVMDTIVSLIQLVTSFVDANQLSVARFAANEGQPIL